MPLNSTSSKKTFLRVLLYLAVFIICIITLYPYFVMFTTALKSRNEIFAMTGTIMPINVMWSNFADIWQKAPMARYLLNSVLTMVSYLKYLMVN